MGKIKKGNSLSRYTFRLAEIFLMAALFCLGGCGKISTVKVEEKDFSNSDSLVTVGFSQLGSESVWRTADTASIRKALTKENGFFLMFNNARQKQENQIKALRSFISQRVDYIAFCPSTERGWDTVLGEAKSAGIPVILVDRMVDVEDESLYKAFVGTDKTEEGRKAGRWLEQYLKESGREDEKVNIVVLKGTVGSTAEIGRTEGFHEISDKHKNWLILEEKSADFTTAKGKEVMQQFIKRYPGINFVVSQNDDMTFGALEALSEAGISVGVDKEVQIISFDAVHAALELVSQGVVSVDVECNPDLGEYLADVIRKLENGEDVEKISNVDEKVFTKENVDQYLDDRIY